MDPFIVEYKNTLTPEFCDEIIQTYEVEQDKHAGMTSSGLNLDIKHTVDYKISLNPNSDLWKDIDIKLYRILQEYLQNYVTSLKTLFFPTSEYKFFVNNILSENGYQIQRYRKNIGKFTYHNDFSVDFSLYRYRAIVYLWYLNDVDEGGETEFLGGKYSVKPEKGKLIFFPASWTYPHMGRIPISNDKYIITGWFYVEENKYVYDRLYDDMAQQSVPDTYYTLKKCVDIANRIDDAANRTGERTCSSCLTDVGVPMSCIPF